MDNEQSKLEEYGQSQEEAQEDIRKKRRRINQMALKEVLVTIGSSVGVYLVFVYLLPLLLPFLLALLLARVLLPVIRYMKKKMHIPMILGSMVSLILVIGVVGTILFFVGRMVYGQLIHLAQDIPMYQQNADAWIEQICSRCDRLFGVEGGTITQFLEDKMTSFGNLISSGIMSSVTNQTMNLFARVLGFVSLLFIFMIAVINIVCDYDEIREIYTSTNIYKAMYPVTSKLSKIGFAYIKTQAVIMGINSAVLVFGLFLLRYRYALLIGGGIAIMDAFPVIGSGLFLIPMAVVALLKKKIVEAFILLVLYGMCELIRSMIEPRLLGGKIGIKPIFMVIAMYVGVSILGVLGFLLGPLALVITKTIVTECLKKEKE